MDRKINKSQSVKGKRRKGQSFGPRSSIRENEMLIRWRVGVTDYASDTSGVIAASGISPSISFSSEFSTVKSLFTQVRCVKARLTFSPRCTLGTTNLPSRIFVGTNMGENGTTYTVPNSPSFVTNLSNPTIIGSQLLDHVEYDMKMPKNLEFSTMDSDIPSVPTPWAGSPGVVSFYGSGFTPSSNTLLYYRVDIEVISHLRGRV